MLSALIDRYFIKKPALRAFVTKLIERDETVTVELFGTGLSVNSLQEHGYVRTSRLMHRSSVLRDEIAVINSLCLILSPEDTFIDIGANVGLFVCSIAKMQRLHPGLALYAFEANPDTYTRLVQSAKPFSIATHNIALSDTDGELEFIRGAVSHVFAAKEHRNAYHLDAPTRRIPCRRLDGFDIAGDRLVLKIDVEGHELNVLRGARGLFDAGRVKAVYLDGFDHPDIIRFLREYDFSFHDGRTLRRAEGPLFSLLALNPKAVPVTG